MRGCLQVICSQGGRRRQLPKCFKMGAEHNRGDSQQGEKTAEENNIC